jgi:eukaryotic-like serine/threonine-protein kinase
VRIWDLATGDPIGRPLSRHTSSIWSLVTTQLDGRDVTVSGEEKGTILV